MEVHPSIFEMHIIVLTANNWISFKHYHNVKIFRWNNWHLCNV